MAWRGSTHEICVDRDRGLVVKRRLAALFWLIMLLPAGPASGRNPPGTLERQAHRLLNVLG
jgi:hypothetical protein